MRDTLVTALISCADNPLRRDLRRFLVGLSCDELQFIAEFLGACILDSLPGSRWSRDQMAERIAEFQRARTCAGCRSEDQDHKMILALEYLSNCRGERFSVARAGHA